MTIEKSTMAATWQPQSDWIMVQVPVTSFLSVNVAPARSLEAAPGTRQPASLLSVNVVTPGSSQVPSRWVPAECEPSFRTPFFCRQRCNLFMQVLVQLTCWVAVDKKECRWVFYNVGEMLEIFSHLPNTPL